MASEIDKKTLEHLAKLARIELAPQEEEKLLKDLQSILGYIDELKNVFRDDDGPASTNQGAGVEAFPDSKNGFLKIPPVFE